MPAGTYWNSRKEAFVAYPSIIEQIMRAMLDAQNGVLDGHVRKTTLETAQDGRSGFYAMAIAAYKVINPSFELEGALW